MSTNDRAVLDGFLSGHSNQLSNSADAFIAEKILPPVSVNETTGKIAGYGDEHLRIVNTVHRGKGKYLEVDTQTYTSDTYEIIDHGLTEIITENMLRNVITPYNVDIDVTAALTSLQIIGKEKALADTLTSAAIITQGVTLSGNNQYNNIVHADSTPIQDAIAAKVAVKDNSGVMVNTAIMNWEVAENLRFHNAFVTYLGYKDMRPGGLSYEEVARALGVKKILIGSATYNTAKRGQAASYANIWGNDIVYAHIADNLELRQKTLGVEVRKSGTQPRQVYRWNNNEPVGSHTVAVLDNYDQLLLNPECAYLLQDVIS